MDDSGKALGTVIIGAGQAACELAVALRQQQYEDRIVIVGDEPLLPYRRPPLSKACLTGEIGAEALLLRRASFYEQQGIACHTGTVATAIDRAQHEVLLADGRRLRYQHLVLATGGRPRPLPLPHAAAPNVHMIRTFADAQRLRAELVAGRRLVVLGAGYIGLEAAASALALGLQVSVVEAGPRVLARSVGPELSAFVAASHRERGMDIRTGARAAALEGDTQVRAVLLSDGTRLAADLIVVGIGLLPNTDLAAAAGLHVDDGIRVDAHAVTSDPRILAIGDCAHHVNAHSGRAMRLESVPSAIDQARTAALTICGRPAAHAAVPWFWSDQGALKLQMVGVPAADASCVLRGDRSGANFSAFYLEGGRVQAVHLANRPQDLVIAKRMVSERWSVEPQRLSDVGVALKDLAVVLASP